MAKRLPLIQCPDELAPDEKRRIVAWVKKEGLDLSRDQLRWAWNTVRDWAQGGGHMRADWVAVLRNAIRADWALRGYQAPRSGYGTHGEHQPTEKQIAARKRVAEAKLAREQESGTEGLSRVQRRDDEQRAQLRLVGG
jgi:hypothetical protein